MLNCSCVWARAGACACVFVCVCERERMLNCSILYQISHMVKEKISIFTIHIMCIC
jgi:hypothetical protein